MTESDAERCPKEFVPSGGCANFGPRGVAKLLRSATACGEMGTPQPHRACAWLLAIFLKFDSNVAYACFSTVS